MFKDFINKLANTLSSSFDKIDSLKPYQDPNYKDIIYALDVSCPPELRRYFAASIIKFKNPQESFDEIANGLDINNYSDENAVSQEDIKLEALCRNLDIVCLVINGLRESIEEKRSLEFGEQLFFLSVTRASSTFKSIVILLRHGMFVEVTPLLRLLFEQYCWMCFVINKKTNDYGIIKNNKTTQNIHSLENAIKDEDIKRKLGKYYGLLSEESHLYPESINKYIKEEEGENEKRLFSSIGRSGTKCNEEVPLVFTSYELYVNVLNYAINEHFDLQDDGISFYNDFIEGQKDFMRTLRSDNLSIDRRIYKNNVF
jgi:hypothetical protein